MTSQPGCTLCICLVRPTCHVCTTPTDHSCCCFLIEYIYLRSLPPARPSPFFQLQFRYMFDWSNSVYSQVVIGAYLPLLLQSMALVRYRRTKHQLLLSCNVFRSLSSCQLSQPCLADTYVHTNSPCKSCLPRRHAPHAPLRTIMFSITALLFQFPFSFLPTRPPAFPLLPPRPMQASRCNAATTTICQTGCLTSRSLGLTLTRTAKDLGRPVKMTRGGLLLSESPPPSLSLSDVRHSPCTC